MDQYNAVASMVARRVTDAYSTSFGSATKLFPVHMRPDIYHIYGMVRMADEIVDTYRGKGAARLLDAYESNVYDALKTGYSTDAILHAFQLTACAYKIDKDLIAPFFASMRFDLQPPKQLTEAQYKTYIYGSAEVVGLMCLKVFCKGDEALYKLLEPGACALGAAFQKVNFLRDIAQDTKVLGRSYFPGVTEDLGEADKQVIIADIEKDFFQAAAAIVLLPKEVQPAVQLAHRYYRKLLNKLSKTPANKLMQTRIRIPDGQKALLLAPALVKTRFKK